MGNFYERLIRINMGLKQGKLKISRLQATNFLRRQAENAMRGRPLFEPVGRVWPRPAAHSQPGADPSLALTENFSKSY